MEWTVLLVDLRRQGAEFVAPEIPEWPDSNIKSSYTSDLDEAQILLSNNRVGSLIVFCDNDFDVKIINLLKQFQYHVGALPDSQLLIADDPSPKFMAGVFEFGIEQFTRFDEWQTNSIDLVSELVEKFKDENSTESITMHLADAISKGDQGEINQRANQLKGVAEYDYRASYSRAKALEAMGKFDDAKDVFSKTLDLNNLYRPSSSGLAESYLVLGKPDEAIAIWEKMEKSNTSDVDRKVFLVSAYTEKGDFQTALKYVKEAESIEPNHNKITEAKAHIYLATGKISNAFALMDQLTEVGPYFATKLNELGIKLSKAGKGKSALSLYQKAHKIVRSEIKYKISLNAALACRRMESYEMALKYLLRCEKEYGGSFPKLELIRKKIHELMAGAKNTSTNKEAS